MFKPVKIPFTGAISYPLSSALLSVDNTEWTRLAAMKLQDPYGNGSPEPAGLVGYLTSESGATVIEIVDGSETGALVFLQDSYADATQSGLMSAFYVESDWIVDTTVYDPGYSYTVGMELTYITTGTNKGKLIPATVYGSNKIVAVVEVAPTNAAANTTMRIKSVYRV